MAGGRPPGIPKTGGRRPGSPNKNQLTEDMRKSIVAVFKKMGGTRWLLTWAKENETEFVRLVLSRVLPAPPREEPAVVVNNNSMLVNADDLSTIEAASRIAFALASAAQQLEPGRIIDVMPEPVKPATEPVKPPPPPASEPVSEQREVHHFGHGAEQGVKRRNLI